MANTLRFKRGLVSGIPTAALGEPLFTTDTFDLYIGNGTTNTRFQKYIASGTTSQLLRGDGSLLTMPIVLTSPSNGQVLKYDGTNWVNSADAGVTGSGIAGQVTYWNGTGTITGSNNLFWDNTNARLGVGTNNPSYTFHTISSASTIGAFRNSGAALGQLLVGNTAADLIIRILASGDSLIYSDTSKYLAFGSNGGTERMRIFSSGNIAINSTSDNGLRFQVTGDGYFSNTLSVGSPITTFKMSAFNAGSFTIGLLNSSIGTVGQHVGITYGFGATTYNKGAMYFVSRDANARGDFYFALNNVANSSNVTTADARMILTYEGNLGLGVTPSAWFSSSKAMQFNAGSIYTFSTDRFFVGQNTYIDATGVDNYYANGFASRYQQYQGQHIWQTAPSGTANTSFTWSTRMTLDASGNLGLGVTPSAWSTNPAFQIKDGGSLWALNNQNLLLSQNVYFDGSFRYIASVPASQYQQSSGTHIWRIAPSGTLGQPITFTQAMTLFATGNLAIGTGAGADAGFRLDVNGTMRVSGASTFGGATSIGSTTDAPFGLYISNSSLGSSATARITLDTQGGTWHIDNTRIGGTLTFTRLSSTYLTIASTGAATFSSTVSATSYRSAGLELMTSDGTSNYIKTGATLFFQSGATTLMSLTTGGNLAVDTNTLFVDAANNRVGVGTSSPTSSLHVVGSVTKSHTTKTANYTMTESDYTVLCDTSAGGFTISLPAASGCSGRIYVIKKITGNSGTNNITIDPNGSETIDGATTYALQCRSSVMIQSNGANWWILAERVDNSCI